jgi:aryl-alcohol dehydrogenase-like predicted oxidoreductase
MASYELKSSRLVLGTAQLGMHYGIGNKTGQPDIRAVESIVKAVWEAGIREFDTAQAYGESEKVLGKVMKILGIAKDARVISKIDPIIKHRDSAGLRRALEQTLARLGISKLYGMMLHKEDLLDSWDKGLSETLHKFIDEGLVERLGISVYTPQNAIRALKTDGISIIQVPSNILDRRFENADVFHKAKLLEKQIYVRSVFLQGLLLMNVCDLPSSIQFAIPVIERLVDFAQKTGFSVKQLAFGYVRKAYPDQKVLFGCETPQQVKENLELWAKELPEEIVGRVQQEFQNIPEKILNPSFWIQTSKA